MNTRCSRSPAGVGNVSGADGGDFLFSGFWLWPVLAVRRARHLIHKHGGRLGMLWSVAGRLWERCQATVQAFDYRQRGRSLFWSDAGVEQKGEKEKKKGGRKINSCHTGKKKPTSFGGSFYNLHSLLHETTSYFAFWLERLLFRFCLWEDTPGIKIFKDERERRHPLSVLWLLFVLTHSHTVAHEYTETWWNLPGRATTVSITRNSHGKKNIYIKK